MTYPPVVVPPACRPYLVAQRGFLDHFRNDEDAWLAAYRASLERDLADLEPVLPARCRAVLDVGAGLGGVDVLLARRYRPPPVVTLLDGAADQPVMFKHDRTFSARGAALALQGANGVQAGYLTPDDVADLSMVIPLYDLVISLQAWCFHVRPLAYLSFVRRHAAPGAVIVVDVRRDQPDWHGELDDALVYDRTLRVERKYERRAYRAGGHRVGA
jgi:SAM-dependent methyltransferase